MKKTLRNLVIAGVLATTGVSSLSNKSYAERPYGAMPSKEAIEAGIDKATENMFTGSEATKKGWYITMREGDKGWTTTPEVTYKGIEDGYLIFENTFRQEARIPKKTLENDTGTSKITQEMGRLKIVGPTITTPYKYGFSTHLQTLNFKDKNEPNIFDMLKKTIRTTYKYGYGFSTHLQTLNFKDKKE